MLEAVAPSLVVVFASLGEDGGADGVIGSKLRNTCL